MSETDACLFPPPFGKHPSFPLSETPSLKSSECFQMLDNVWPGRWACHMRLRKELKRVTHSCSHHLSLYVSAVFKVVVSELIFK